jgi:hypothetical protein
LRARGRGARPKDVKLTDRIATEAIAQLIEEKLTDYTIMETFLQECIVPPQAFVVETLSESVIIPPQVFPVETLTQSVASKLTDYTDTETITQTCTATTP